VLELELTRFGIADLDRLAGQLVLLIEAAHATSTKRPECCAGRTERSLAGRLLD
jgi:hypothetical protein